MLVERYDKLLDDYLIEELDVLKLVRVNENFRVIVFGYFVFRYRGNVFDLLLRFWFQFLDINVLLFKEQFEYF